nr:zinc-type alcohol dehydrogenase-like protein [Quercus suber]
MVLPKSYTSWTVDDFTGFDATTINRDVSIPGVGPYDILLRIEAASLNFRDLMIAKVSSRVEKGVVPGSDGAGTVVATGDKVTRFQKGNRVYTITHVGYLAGDLDDQATKTSLGGSLDGTFRQYGVFPEWGLVSIPETINFREAASLPAAGITAWNALYGIPGRGLKAGDVVLTQGTGGVSMFAAQFTLAAGGIVIATTSSASKAEKLKAVGVQHIINYRENAKWGETAKSLTRGNSGVDFVVEVGGPATLGQSLAAVRRAGIIASCGAVGGLGGSDVGPALISAWTSSCIVRGVAVGSRAHAEDMNKAIESAGLRPILDPQTFTLEELKKGYQYLESQRHFGKVIIDCQ